VVAQWDKKINRAYNSINNLLGGFGAAIIVTVLLYFTYNLQYNSSKILFMISLSNKFVFGVLEDFGASFVARLESGENNRFFQHVS
jgi:hypothetical protein